MFATDCGLLGLWDPSAFAQVVDHETWEPELCEDADILRHIAAGAFVPVGIDRGVDGAFEVHLRVGSRRRPAVLSEREAGHVLGRSDPYLFRCTGRFCVSGLEHVEGAPGRHVGSLPFADGEFAVRVHLMDWGAEPDMKDRRGRPRPGSLPDFVVLANPKGRRVKFRQQVHALDPHRGVP